MSYINLIFSKKKKKLWSLIEIKTIISLKLYQITHIEQNFIKTGLVVSKFGVHCRQTS